MKPWIYIVKILACGFSVVFLVTGGVINPDYPSAAQAAWDMPAQSQQVFLGSAGEVVIVEAWVTSTDTLPQKFLFPGSPVRYHGMISNQTGEIQVVETNWLVEGPCGVIVNSSHTLITPIGIVEWIYIDSLSLAECAGNYVLTVSLDYSGQTSQVTTEFEVVKNRIFLPMARR